MGRLAGLNSRRGRFALALLVLVPGALGMAVGSAYADTTTASADHQGYNWDDSNAPDPYNNPATGPDGYLHVATANGNTEAHAVMHLDFGDIPQGSQINEFNLTVVQASTQPSDMVSAQSQQPGLTACVLTQTFTGKNTTAPYDCTKYPKTNGDFDSATNTWTFDLQTLTAAWDKIGNTGLAIVPDLIPPPGTSEPTNADIDWSISLVPAKTKATVDYTPGSSFSNSVESAPQPLSLPVSSGLAVAPPPLPVTVPPAGKAPTAAAPSTTGRAATGVVPLSKVETSRVWIGVAAALVLLALLLVVGGGALNLLRSGSLSLAGAGGALTAAWPQVATPAAVLLAAAVIAGGFSGRLVTVAAPGSVSAASGGTAAANGTGGAAAAGQGAASGALGAAGSGAAGSGTAAAGGGSAGASGPLPVGVTPTTVKLGFFTITNNNAQNAALGISGLNNLGSDKDQVNALIDWINKHGGIAGHRAVPVFVNVDGNNTDPTYPEQLCKTMTEDEQVFAVISGGHSEDREATCYIQHHTFYVNDGLGLFSQQFMLQNSPYIWTPSQPVTDRAELQTLEALNAKGFFTSTDPTKPIKVGMLYPNVQSTQDVVNNLVIPTLVKYGVSRSNIYTATVDEYSGSEETALSQINNAALNFDTNNVNRVMFPNDIGAAQYIFFARDADAQKYVPTYGLNSSDGLDAVGYLVPEEQKAGSVDIGWWPWTDTSQANSMGFPDSQAEATCYQIMNQHGIYSSQAKGHERDGEGTVQMESYCDMLFMVYYAAQGLGQNLNATNLAAGIERLGSTFQDAVDYPNSTYFGPRHHDGTDDWRYIVFDPSCTTGYDGGTGSPPQGCFKYADGNFHQSPEV